MTSIWGDQFFGSRLEEAGPLILFSVFSPNLSRCFRLRYPEKCFFGEKKSQFLTCSTSKNGYQVIQVVTKLYPQTLKVRICLLNNGSLNHPAKLPRGFFLFFRQPVRYYSILFHPKQPFLLKNCSPHQKKQDKQGRFR